MPMFDRGIATENCSAGLRGNGAQAHGGYPAADRRAAEDHDYEEAQLDAEQALLLANVAPADDED
jgi:hypothetical protein